MPTASEVASTAHDDALARAVVWRQIALGFLPPGDALIPSLEDTVQRRALSAALEHLGLPRFEAGATGGLGARFGELFGHTVRAVVCPYETEYGAGRIFQQTHELADLNGWYAAFGLEPREGICERADHIGFECDFAGFLCRKEAHALDRRDDEQLEVVRSAYRRFLRDHLARFGIAVTTRIGQADPGGFYGRLAALCQTILIAECARLDVEKGPRALPLRADSEDDVPAACGAGSDCEVGDCEVGSPLGRAAPRRLLSIGDREAT